MSRVRFDNVFSVVPLYCDPILLNACECQDDYQAFDGGSAFKIYAPHDRLLPFFWIQPKPEQVNPAIRIYTCEGDLVVCLNGDDVAESIITYELGDYMFITYNGGQIAGLNLTDCGCYYLNVNGMIGEKFYVKHDLDCLMKVELAHSRTLKNVPYQAEGFKQWFWLDHKLCAPSYKYFDESEDNGQGEKTVLFQALSKSYKLELFDVPRYMADVLNGLGLLDNVTITTKTRKLNLTGNDIVAENTEQNCCETTVRLTLTERVVEDAVCDDAGKLVVVNHTVQDSNCENPVDDGVCLEYDPDDNIISPPVGVMPPVGVTPPVGSGSGPGESTCQIRLDVIFDCIEGTSGLVSAMAHNGSGTYEYQIDNGSWVNSIVNEAVTIGSHTIRVRDRLNIYCTTSRIIDICSTTAPDGTPPVGVGTPPPNDGEWIPTGEYRCVPTDDGTPVTPPITPPVGGITPPVLVGGTPGCGCGGSGCDECGITLNVNCVDGRPQIIISEPCSPPVGPPTPPVGSPPVGSPPVGSPPVGSPPVGSPPVGVGSPPVGSPPVGSPPVGSPPVGSPPVGSPPVGSPPVGSPPVGSPPVGSPPVGSPPVGSPPVGSPPVGSPPVGSPVGVGTSPPVGSPVGSPPVGSPPVGSPPVGEPVGTPPVGEPVGTPPVGEPVGTPPVGVGTPPVGSPPVGSPPVGSPPVGSPPVGSPPPSCTALNTASWSAGDTPFYNPVADKYYDTLLQYTVPDGMGGVVMAYYYDDEVSAPVATEAGCPPSDLLMGESSIVIGDATCEDDRHIDVGSETCYTRLNVMNYINLDCKLVKVLMFELPCETNCGLFCLPETTGDVAESIVPNPPPVGIGAPVGVGTPPVGVGTPPVGEPVGTPPVGEPVGTPPVGVGTPPVGVGTPPVGGEPLVMGSVRMNLANYGCTQITDECLDITIRLEHLVYEAVDYVWNFAEGIDRTVCKTIPSGNYRLRIDSSGDCLNTLQIRRNSTQLPNEPTALGLLILTTELGTPAETIISVPESASCSEAETFGLDLYVHQLCACPTLAVEYVYQMDECTQRIVAINANDGDLEYGWSDTNDIEDVTNWQTSPDFDFEENGTRWAFVRFATDHDCVSVGKAFPVGCTTNPPVGVGTPPVGEPVGTPPVGVGTPPVGSPPVGSPPPVGTWEPTGDTLCIPYCDPIEIGVVIDFTEETPPPPPIVAPLKAANADFYFTNGKYFDPLSNYDLRFTVEVETTGLSITGDSCNIGSRHIGGGTLSTDYVISAFGRSQGASPAPPSEPYVAFYRFGFNLEKLQTDFPSETFFRFKVLAKRVGSDPYNRYNYYGRMNISTANELVTITNNNGVDFAFDGVDVVYTDYPTPPALEIVPAGASETLVGYIEYDTSTETFVYQP